MNKKRDREDRMLGINGQRPTARDRWGAFWRLYRLCLRQYGDNSSNAFDALRMLGFGGWIADVRLGGAGPGLVNQRHVPLFLRRRLLDMARRRRLYGNWCREWEDLRPLDQRAARHLAAQGVEMTPDEVAEVRAKFVRHVRSKAATLGLPLPESDYELLQVVKGWMAEGE